MTNPFPLALAALLASATVSAQPVSVVPVRETQPNPAVTGGALRDVALWVNPADGGASLLLTAYDNANAGLVTFGMDGAQQEAELDGPVQGVAVHDDFPLAGGSRTLVVAASTTFNGLVAYRLDPGGAERVVRIGIAGFLTGTQYSTVALYRSPTSGRFYVFAGTAGGRLEQFELTGADGGVTGLPARVLATAGGGIAGVVADEETGRLFVTEEGQGLWRYSAEADGGQTRLKVASVGAALNTDVGRVSLYRASNGEGYILVADTASGAFAVFERRSESLVGSFQVVASDGGIDAVVAPVALAVASRPVGPDFPDGLFVAHDGVETPAENLKLVSWPAVANAFNPPLRIDTRQVTDGGTDAGTGGTDAGPDVRPQPLPVPGDGDADDDSGCSCATASVPASALLGLLALALAGRRRRS
ncbi:myxosortase-dependent phytase-like phosphatase [Pyxidicoccus sp. MSG2]|uniref:myxosortase-dependent phytase-like phosphatase n=1 Tax=Pyxidicoccus sp. MSG2 TaxID=2996790 RepID=UPI002270D70B|nr:myxosortase-dependent phytase-like phosphatase [Pyxidicoccus sp. MSG2]MCY1021215.1 phytase [Pyxidicoccus sp. MSG2]